MRDSALVPLTIYWAIAIGLPLLNGAAARPEFSGHAAETVALSGAIAAAWIAIRSWRSRSALARSRSRRSR